MRKRLLLSLALVILAQGSLVLALDCSQISLANTPLCQQILESNLTMIEQEALISNLEYNNTYFPDHNYIFLRNTAIPINNAPLDVQTHNGDILKNAWVSLFSLMPSVIYNNSLFVPEQTQVLTGFNYDIVLPSNYKSSRYPSTSQGDCRRDYILIDNLSENKVFANDIYQGSGRLVNARIFQDSNISATFNIVADYSIQHYKWNEYSDNYCSGICYSCDLSGTENKNDKLTLTDSLTVKYYDNNLTAEVTPIDFYKNNTKLRVNYSNSIELNFSDSYYNYYQYSYSINYSKEPYYISTLEAQDYNAEEISNLFRNGDEIILKDNNVCNVLAFDFFNVIQAGCNSNYFGFDFNISTDHFYYADNESINVSIYPKNSSIYLTYANQNESATGNASFIAQYPYNKITAFYGNKRYDKLIFVYDKSKLILLCELILFFLLIYLFYKIMNNYYRRTHGR